MKTKYALFAGVVILIVTGGLLLNLYPRLQFSQQCSNKTSTIDFEKVKEAINNRTVYSDTLDEVSYQAGNIFEDEDNYLLLTQLSPDRGEDSYFCISKYTNGTWETITEDHFRYSLFSTEVNFELRDYNGDNIKDIAIEVSRNYDIQASYALWINRGSGRFFRISQFEENFSPVFDSAEQLLKSRIITGPAKGGYIYSEYKWSGTELILTRKITQEVIVEGSQQPQFKITIYSIDNDGNQSPIETFISGTYYEIPMALQE